MLSTNGKVTFDEKAMFDLLDNPKGTVGHHLQKIGLEILYGARAMVGVRTGRLKRSLNYRQGLRGRVQYVAVGSNVKYALMHHEGTRHHTIRAHQGRLLRFNVGGRVVYARKVNHPGTRPNRYLTIPMRKAVRG
jgi:hypothetical protein